MNKTAGGRLWVLQNLGWQNVKKNGIAEGWPNQKRYKSWHDLFGISLVCLKSIHQGIGNLSNFAETSSVCCQYVVKPPQPPTAMKKNQELCHYRRETDSQMLTTEYF